MHGVVGPVGALRSGPAAVALYVMLLPALLVDVYPYITAQGVVLTGLWIGGLDAERSATREREMRACAASRAPFISSRASPAALLRSDVSMEEPSLGKAPPNTIETSCRVDKPRPLAYPALAMGWVAAP